MPILLKILKHVQTFNRRLWYYNARGTLIELNQLSLYAVAEQAYAQNCTQLATT